jgi:hypothetical protein
MIVQGAQKRTFCASSDVPTSQLLTYAESVWSTSWSWSRLRVSYGSWRSSFSAGGTRLREAVPRRLMDAGRQLVPFRFIIYAGLPGIKNGACHVTAPGRPLVKTATALARLAALPAALIGFRPGLASRRPGGWHWLFPAGTGPFC